MRDEKGRFIKGSAGFTGKHTEESKRKMSESRKGITAGKDHPMYGKHHTKEARMKIKEARKNQMGSRCPNWKGDDVSYSPLHQWLKRQLGKAKKCSNNISHSGRFEWANISGEYKRDINDWHELCHTCNLNDGIKIPERLKERRAFA